jgi:hypothetical protein
MGALAVGVFMASYYFAAARRRGDGALTALPLGRIFYFHHEKSVNNC